MSYDLFRRMDYRRFVAWESRIQREMPFFRRLFDPVRPGPLLDLACGTGEHAAALTEAGFELTALDISPGMLARAREAFPHIPLVNADMAHSPLAPAGSFAGAYCLGNSLAILLEDEQIRSTLAALRAALAAGAPFLIQILNYTRIRELGIRHLPLNFRPSDDGEILYLRILDPIDDRRIRFEVLSLERQPPEGESRIVAVNSRIMRSLREEEVSSFLREAGFEEVTLLGDFAGAPYEPLESNDLIVVAR